MRSSGFKDNSSKAGCRYKDQVRIEFRIELYLYGESIKVVEHDMIGFRQQGRITLQGKGEQKRAGEKRGSYKKDESRHEEMSDGEMEKTLTDIFVSLLRMTWRR